MTRKLSENECKAMVKVIRISFDELFERLSRYVQKYGNCKVPIAYNDEDGIPIGNVVHSIRTGNRKITEAQKILLDKIGFVWRVNQTPASFDEIIYRLTNYVQTYGDCMVPALYKDEDGFALGWIVQRIRTGKRKISEAQKIELDKIDFVWNATTPFDEFIRSLLEFKAKHGHCKVPISYVSPDGIKLGNIVHNIRRGSRKVNPTQRQMLDSIGFCWCIKNK